MSNLPTYPATVHSCGATITYQEPKILAIASVGGPAFEIRQDSTGVDDDGTVWEPSTTVLQIVGIGGRPFMSIKSQADGTWYRPTSVANPERFGSWPADDCGGKVSSPAYRSARAWVQAFAHANVA